MYPEPDGGVNQAMTHSGEIVRESGRLVWQPPSILGEVRIPLTPRTLPSVPELSLWLMPEAVAGVGVPSAALVAAMDRLPYWGWCWGGGQAMARFILDHPEWVIGQRVIDFGAGSGVAGIAALRAGARHVCWVDSDPTALCAVQENAELNGGMRGDCLESIEPAASDVVLASDICYEPAGAALVRAWAKRGCVLLVAESRLTAGEVAIPGARWLGAQSVRTFPDLGESHQHDRVSLLAAGMNLS